MRHITEPLFINTICTLKIVYGYIVIYLIYCHIPFLNVCNDKVEKKPGTMTFYDLFTVISLIYGGG